MRPLQLRSESMSLSLPNGSCSFVDLKRLHGMVCAITMPLCLRCLLPTCVQAGVFPTVLTLMHYQSDHCPYADRCCSLVRSLSWLPLATTSTALIVNMPVVVGVAADSDVAIVSSSSSSRPQLWSWSFLLLFESRVAERKRHPKPHKI